MPKDINNLISMLAIKLYSNQDGMNNIDQQKKRDCVAEMPNYRMKICRYRCQNDSIVKKNDYNNSKKYHLLPHTVYK